MNLVFKFVVLDIYILYLDICLLSIKKLLKVPGFFPSINNSMKASYILFSVTAGVFVFCCVSVFFGPSGKNAYRELQAQKVNLVENIEKIEGISKSLKAEITALDYDDEIIKMYAHELGFVCEGERLIKLADYIEPGLSAFQRYQSGTPYHVEEPQTVPEWVSAFLGLLCVLFFLLFFYNFQKVGN